MPDMQQACVKVDIGVGESQKLPGPQSGKIQKAQGSAENCVSHWRCLSSRQFDGSLQETFAFVSAEHARHKFPAHNSQGPAIRYYRAGVFQAQETADLWHESQTMRAVRLR